MTYEAIFDPFDRIIKVRISGLANYEDLCSVLNDVVRLCQENNCSRILVDLVEASTSNDFTMKLFDFGHLAARKLPHIPVANVLPKESKARKDVIFTSTVVINRGGLFQEFDSSEEAREWLLTKNDAGNTPQ